MLLDNLMADVEARGGVTRVFQMILAASLLTNVFLAGTFMTMDRTVRTILSPPEVNKSFWVDGRSLSPEYMEQMGAWVIKEYATVTPSNIDYQNNLLLKYVHPSVHGELTVRFKMGANRLKAENMSKIFSPREVRISEKGQAIAFIGTQSTWIADKRLPNDEVKAYLVAFSYDGSQTYIKELRETNPSRPFDAPDQQANAEPDTPITLPPAETSAATLQSAPGAPATSAAPQVIALPPAPQASNPAAKEALQSGAVPTTPNTR